MTDNTDELAGLTEDVREALERIELIVGVSGDDLPVIRAELLRLARENAELRNGDECAGCAMNRQMRAMAEAELAALKRRIAEAPRTVVPVEDDGSGLVGKTVALLPAGGE